MNYKAEKAVEYAVKKSNQTMLGAQQVPEDPDAEFLMNGMDSLALTTLVGMVELELEAEFCKPVSLANDKAFANGKNPFRTLNTLIEYAEEVINEEDK